MRNKRITCRLTDDEFQKLNKIVADKGMSLSDYLRALTQIEPRKQRKAKAMEIDPAVINHLARIGNNLNQIARNLNNISDLNLKQNLFELLAEIENELRRILYDCENVETRSRID